MIHPWASRWGSLTLSQPLLAGTRPTANHRHAVALMHDVPADNHVLADV